MTPEERARHIDKEEFEAECAAIRQRAYATIGRKTHIDERVQAWIDRVEHIVDAPKRPFMAHSSPIKRAMAKETSKRALASRANRYEAFGENLTISEWAEKTGIPVNTIRNRMFRGNSFENAVSPKLVKPKIVANAQPKRKQPKPVKVIAPKISKVERITINGLSLTRAEWAEHLGITYGALMVRMSRLGSTEAAVNLDKKREACNVRGKTVNEWAEHFGVARSVLYRRIKLNGSAEAVIAELSANPPAVYNYAVSARNARTYEHDGKTRTLGQWADEVGLNVRTIRWRLHSGWSLALALNTASNARPGVSSDFAPSAGTGAGSTAQETPNITFSGIEA
jgi:hypothetical protein